MRAPGGMHARTHAKSENEYIAHDGGGWCGYNLLPIGPMCQAGCNSRGGVGGCKGGCALRKVAVHTASASEVSVRLSAALLDDGGRGTRVQQLWNT